MKLRVDLDERAKKVLAYRKPIPVHVFYAYSDVCVDYNEAVVRKTYMYVFPNSPVVETYSGGVTVVKERRKTYVFLHEDSMAVVIESFEPEEKIFGLKGGKIYVLNTYEDVEDFTNGYEEIFDPLEV